MVLKIKRKGKKFDRNDVGSDRIFKNDGKKFGNNKIVLYATTQGLGVGAPAIESFTINMICQTII